MGGVAINGDNIYLSSNRKVFTVDKKMVMEAQDILNLSDWVGVNNRASFVECDEDYLYVGEFHYTKKYETNHHIRHEKNDYYAICTAYPLTDLSKPAFVYAIPDMVQGFCVTKEKQVVLSLSYGLKDAKFYIYEKHNIMLYRKRR